MICKVCATNADGDFCPNCGTPFEKEQNINSYYQQPQPVQQYIQTAPPAKKKGNGLMIALIAIGAALVIGVFAVVGLVAKGNVDKGGKADTDSVVVDAEDSPEDPTDASTQEKVDYQGNQIDMPDPDENIIQPDFFYNERTLYVEPDVGLILRTGPGQNYEKILTIEFAKDVVVMGGCNSADNWIYIFYSGYYGWVCSDYLVETMPKKDYNSNNKSNINSYYRDDQYYEYYEYIFAYVSPSAGLNLRSGASTSCHSVVVLPRNTQVTVMGYSPYDTDWRYVYCCYNGRDYYGFVNADYLDS